MENRNQFIENVKQGIGAVLPKEFAECTIKIQPIQKMDEEYIGMVVEQKKQSTHVIINMDEWYDTYCEGTSLEDIIDAIALQVQKEVLMQPLEWLQDYEQVKERIYYRLYPEKDVRRELQNVPHKKICDLILAYHILVQDQNGALSSILVKNEMLDDYGVSVEEFKKDAEKSTVKLFPARIEQYGTDADFYVITNAKNVNGAAVLFYPGVFAHLSKVYGGTFMLIPSSIHEFFAISKVQQITCKELDDMVEKGNVEISKQGNILLADHGYVYDPSYKRLETTKEYRKRTGREVI